MRLTCHVAACLLTLTLPVAAGPVFTIRAETERSGSSMTGDAYGTRARLSSMSISSVRYVFHIRASALAPEEALAEWVVIGTDTDGTPRDRTRGQTTLRFPKRERHAMVRTDTIALSNEPGVSYSDEIYGYGFRLTDAAGALLGEKYSPAAARSRITWSTPTHAVPAPPPAPRPTVPMPVVF